MIDASKSMAELHTMLVISVCLGVICVIRTVPYVTLVTASLSNCSLVLKALISAAGMLIFKPLLSCLLPSLPVMHTVEDMTYIVCKDIVGKLAEMRD